MKNLCLCLCLCLCFASASLAQSLIGARAAGMGGVGTAVSRDLSCAYYNPAGYLKAQKAGMMASLGLTSSNTSKILSAASKISDPFKFFSNNYAENLNFAGTISGLGGVTAGYGITLLPIFDLSVNKPASSLSGTIEGNLRAPLVMTLGYSFDVPYVGNVGFGTNLKYVYAASGNITGATTTAAQTLTTGGGFGLDAGVIASVSVPFVSEVAIGVTARNLMQTISTSTKTQNYNLSGSTYTLTSESTTTGSVTDPTSYVIGASAVIPGSGVLVAADIENVSGVNPQTNTHIGAEYPVIAGLLALRAGTASGNNLSLTTYGAKIEIPVFTINAAYVADGKNLSNSYYVLDLVGGI